MHLFTTEDAEDTEVNLVQAGAETVSYTHLTLPTNSRV